jgi:hypothetical protein
MTDTNITEFPSPSPPTRAAIRQRRYRKRRKAATRATAKPRATVTPSVTPVAHATVTAAAHKAGRQAIDLAAYSAAVALAGCAAWLSIRGMLVLFSSAPIAVVAMAVAMEAAKLVTAGWLASRWRATAWVWRLVLVTLVAGLAAINATGVYAQLVSLHLGDRGERESHVTSQDADLAGRIELASHAVTDLDTRVSQIDAAIAAATQRGKVATALSTMEGQRRARAGLTSERERAGATLAALKAERASVAAQGHQIEVEAAPIRYVAELAGTDSEQAIRWLIALMVLCCDPLAIALTAAVAGRR